MPIVMSKSEWARITKWTDTDKEDPETARRREYVKYLNAASNEMTKNWPNSLENINKRNEELRQARISAAEQANTKFYKRYVKRKKEEQERLMFSARDSIFKNKDAPKLLLGAVIESVIQKERSEQLKFLNERRREAVEQKRKDDDEIIRKAKEWNDLMDSRKKKRFEVNKHHQKEILDQAHEVAERKRKEYEDELNMQKVDNIKADEQMAAIKEFETKFKAGEKARIWADMEQSRRECEARRREQEAREQLDDQLLDVLQRSRATVERRRKQTEKEEREEKLRVLEKISQKLQSGDAERDAKEQAILDKAIQEKEAADEARREAQRRQRELARRQREEQRAQQLRDEAQRRRDRDTGRRWEIMNRFKNGELYEDFQEKLRLEKERKIKEYREDILKLWKERDDRSARERADTRRFYGELAELKLRRADNKLLTHAAALLREARQAARPQRPILRAVDRYCKLYRLYPMPELPASMQEHFGGYAPRDASRPDEGYREPAPPPPDRGPDAPDEPEPGPDAPGEPEPEPDAPGEPETGPAPRRDGLQPVGEEAGAARRGGRGRGGRGGAGGGRGGAGGARGYACAGRADGLQPRLAQPELSLPPLGAPQCGCRARAEPQ